ncbi:hypothetical protein ENUP19_0158G0041 [Entamoeba nuttalli]|uniref:Uncharacterized protein n=1 Tax=Entamoeba nuttalli TaxID=412467 RepID=A0ABQ0DLD8_9EUKA
MSRMYPGTISIKHQSTKRSSLVFNRKTPQTACLKRFSSQLKNSEFVCSDTPSPCQTPDIDESKFGH